MTKKINPNLTAEQKLILFEEGTERAGSSELNHEKREGTFLGRHRLRDSTWLRVGEPDLRRGSREEEAC